MDQQIFEPCTLSEHGELAIWSGSRPQSGALNRGYLHTESWALKHPRFSVPDRGLPSWLGRQSSLASYRPRRLLALPFGAFAQDREPRVGGALGPLQPPAVPETGRPLPLTQPGHCATPGARRHLSCVFYLSTTTCFNVQLVYEYRARRSRALHERKFVALTHSLLAP